MGFLQKLMQHRVIIVVYLLGTGLAISELRLPPHAVGPLDGPQGFFDEETSVADVSAEIYPDRALTLYYQAFQKSLCTGPKHQRPEGCDRYEPVKEGEVRELIERAIAKGNRSIEQLLYNYAVLLVQEGAPEEEIAAAVRNWRVTHPTSDRPDPRTLGRQSRKVQRP